MKPAMNVARAIRKVKDQGSTIEIYGSGKGQVKILNLKQPKRNGLSFWRAVDYLRWFGFRVNSQ